MINKPIIGVAALIFVLAAGGVYYLRSRNRAAARDTRPGKHGPRRPESRPSRIRCRMLPGMPRPRGPCLTWPTAISRCAMLWHNLAVRTP